MVPVMPQPIPAKMSHIPTKVQTFYSDFVVNMKDDKLHIQQLLFQDYLYQQFKFEFSMYINEYNNKSIKGNVKTVINENLTNDIKLANTIESIMKPIVSLKSLPSGESTVFEVTPGLSIGTCYSINNENMCRRNEMCESSGGGDKCGIRMNNQILELFSYLLAQDMINNSNERMYIMDGKYIPVLYMSNRLLARMDESIVNGQNLYNEINNIKMERFHRNLPLTEYLGKTDNTHILSNAEYDDIKTSMERERIRSINKLSNILANISLDYLLPEHLTIATPFDSEGRINIRMNAGPCIFPYLDTSSYKLVYNCSKNEKQLMTCPTLLNIDRKPTKWGYCPEDPDITKKRMNIIPVDTIKDDKGEYQSGRCIFPFIDKYNNLQYECIKGVNEHNNEFSWCPIKFKNSSDFAPVAANNLGQIWKDKWRYKNLFKQNTSKISEDFMNVSAKGYCQPPGEKVEISKEEGTGDEPPIMINTYQPLNCLDTPSKGGYTKEQLYNFGKNVLKIPYVLMKKGDNKLSKKYLCKIINDKFRALKQHELKTSNFYERDIDKCTLGEKKGGYKLQELRELGVQHYGLSVEKANEMSKEQLCDYIVPIVKKEKNMGEGNIIENIKETEDLSSVYKKNIDACAKSKKRGGYSRKELINIAIHKFGLKITNDMLKEEICKLVKDKITVIKNAKQQNITSKQGGIKDVGKRIKTIKLERAKTFKDLDILDSADTDDKPISRRSKKIALSNIDNQ
jgi:hypothetical protein